MSDEKGVNRGCQRNERDDEAEIVKKKMKDGFGPFL
jgi:hypothetical protein